ncbi:DUF134 domain-containing protein [Propionivibrio limicola]|uniref:DUF134 domain-containing protein n=1 Tax=Propionivibrio limicola TaxID=167645 RepID=UPI001292AA78|nr:DUF134 domain-containing protein [Propionivibrio limicola]
MGRPIKCRKVCCQIAAVCFKPQCASVKNLDEVVLGLDEIEAIRLADFEGLYQADAAACMGIARQTFGKIIAQAHKKVATALIGGKVLRIAPNVKTLATASDRENPPESETDLHERETA